MHVCFLILLHLGTSLEYAWHWLALQVATVVVAGEQPPLALSNTWVRRAHVALPPLALAADDALLTFGEALNRTMQAPTW